MRKVIVSMNTTLDGFMAGPNGELDWHFPLWNTEMASVALEDLDDVDTILLGRRTYQAMEAYWPSAPFDSFSNKMNNYKKIVFSNTLKKASWKSTTIISENVPDTIRKIKQLPGKDMIIYGSSSIVHLFFQHNLIDEYRLWIHPVAITNGVPLFKDTHHNFNLKLLRNRTFCSGVVINYYRPF